MKSALLTLGTLTALLFVGCGGSESAAPTVNQTIPAESEIVIGIHGLNKDTSAAQKAWSDALEVCGDAEIADAMRTVSVGGFPEKAKPILDLLGFNPETKTIRAASYVFGIDLPEPLTAETLDRDILVSGLLADPAFDIQALPAALEQYEADSESKTVITQRDGWLCLDDACAMRMVETLGVQTASRPSEFAPLAKDSPLAAALTPVDGADVSMILCASDVGTALKKAMALADGTDPKAVQAVQAACPALFEAKTLYTALSFTDTAITVTVRLSLPDAERAEAIKETISAFRTMLRMQLALMELPTALSLLDAAKPTVIGSDVSLSLTVTPDTLVAIRREADAMLMKRMMGPVSGNAD